MIARGWTISAIAREFNLDRWPHLRAQKDGKPMPAVEFFADLAELADRATPA
jgi:hypothetical protein